MTSSAGVSGNSRGGAGVYCNRPLRIRRWYERLAAMQVARRGTAPAPIVWVFSSRYTQPRVNRNAVELGPFLITGIVDAAQRITTGPGAPRPVPEDCRLKTRQTVALGADSLPAREPPTQPRTAPVEEPQRGAGGLTGLGEGPERPPKQGNRGVAADANAHPLRSPRYNHLS